jgi:hypothetical protein
MHLPETAMTLACRAEFFRHALLTLGLLLLTRVHWIVVYIFIAPLLEH